MKIVRLEDFGKGLNLASGPLDPAYAIDALDVTYGRAIRTRPGFAALTALSRAYTHLHPFRTASGTKTLLAARSGNTDAINTSGAAAYTTAKTFVGATSFAAPGAECAYLGNGSDTVFKFTGTAFSSPAGMPKAKYLCVQSPDNRLVATGFATGANGPGGSTVTESTVHFSDELAPETWTANSYVQLTPGDGEKIQGCVAWRDMVFVFKESKFFVFNGNTVDSAGLPRFNRREVNGAGLVAPKAIATAPEGVYFLAKDGIYLTNGGNPQQVLRQEMGPVFENTAPPFFTSGVVTQSQIANAAATYHGGRLYVSLSMGGESFNNRTIVFDPPAGWWSVYSLAGPDLVEWSPGDKLELIVALPSDSMDLVRHHAGEIDDNGVPIPAFSRQAWVDLQSQVSLREIHLWGNGRITASAAVDYDPDSGIGQTVSLGTPPDLWDGTTWGGGTWGPSETNYNPANLRGFGARGKIFSITFLGGGTIPLKLEQASCTFLGGRDQE